jgi:hypothetical protein
MTNIFFGFGKRISLVILAMVVLFCYTNLPESIAISHDALGKPEKFTEKENFFYWAAGLVFGFNFLMSLLDSQLQKVDFLKINPTSKWANESPSLKRLIHGWISGFVATVNTFLIFVILGLNNINSNKGQKLDFNYNWLLILGVFLLLIIIFILPFKLLFTNPKPSDD